MNSERQKREEEIERLMRGAGLSQDADVAFQERMKKAASDIFAQETSRIKKTERPERRRPSLSLRTVALLVLALGAVLSFSVPSAGALVLLCGIALLAWAHLGIGSKSNPAESRERTDDQPPH